MTIPRYNAIVKYWSQFPPTNLAVGAALGNKNAPKLTIAVDAEDTEGREEAAARAAADMSAFVAIAGQMPGMLMHRIPKGGKTFSGIPIDEI